MKYTLNLDENNYILSIANTADDNVELDLESMELEYLQAYQYIDDTLTLDENKKAEIIAEEEERKRKEQEPTDFEKLEAQITYTAMMTDTILEE